MRHGIYLWMMRLSNPIFRQQQIYLRSITIDQQQQQQQQFRLSLVRCTF
jgi:hypothetical protein